MFNHNKILHKNINTSLEVLLGSLYTVFRITNTVDTTNSIKIVLSCAALLFIGTIYFTNHSFVCCLLLLESTSGCSHCLFPVVVTSLKQVVITLLQG
jgi:hypothetical protein